MQPNLDDLARLGRLRAPLDALRALLAAAEEEAHLLVVGGVFGAGLLGMWT